MTAFTPTGVKPSANSTTTELVAAETIAEGEAVTESGWVVDPADPAKTKVAGLAFNDASVGDKVVVVSDGDMSCTNAMTPQRQIIAARGHQLQYDADLVSTDAYIVIGYSKDANTITVRVEDTGVTSL